MCQGRNWGVWEGEQSISWISEANECFGDKRAVKCPQAVVCEMVISFSSHDAQRGAIRAVVQHTVQRSLPLSALRISTLTSCLLVLCQISTAGNSQPFIHLLQELVLRGDPSTAKHLDFPDGHEKQQHNNVTNKGASSDAPAYRPHNPHRLCDDDAPHRTERLPASMRIGCDTSHRDTLAANAAVAPSGTLGESVVGR